MNTPQGTPSTTHPVSPVVVIKLAPLTPKDIAKYSDHRAKGILKPVNSNINGQDSIPSTPKPNLELASELKKVINERNILTSKTRKRVFACLDEIKSKTEKETLNFSREKSLLEIVNSEIKYVQQLETIINFFMKPAIERKLLKPDHYEILFGNINTIYDINKELLNKLDKGFDNVANAFSKIAPFLKLYSVYAYEFRKSITILQNARSCNPNFAKFVENQETRPEVQSKLSALLIAPIQRVPRYKLLLNQLFQLSTPEDKDFKLLRDCMDKIDEAASHINNVVEEQENAQRLLELQRYLRSGDPNIIMPGRRLKKEGILHKMSTKQNGHSEKLYVVLMNDIIMFNKMKSKDLIIGSLKTYCILPLNKCKVTEILDKGCLKINCQDEELILYHDQLSEMLAWIESIKQAIDDYLEDRKTLRKESSNRRPVKQKDLNEYHEVGISPGQPLKKRKIVVGDDPMSPRFRTRISSRRPIRSACNSTPIKLESNPETRYLNETFPRMDTTNFSSGGDSGINGVETRKNAHLGPGCIEPLLRNDNLNLGERTDVFVFGRKREDQNVSKMGTFFKNLGSSVKGFLGFKSNSM
ncbi:rho guanine nucleotide exchange factor 39-like [Euwallacea similis]|uniref:rho guanine nucleotide exchange factor 39-like n=1 Tax=Euwallacea similis TaxID=1736056 RepID=UPI00344EAC5D